MLLWRIYLWFFSGLLVASGAGRFFLYWKKPGAVSRLDLWEAIAGLVAIPALVGFAYQRPEGFEWIWRVLCLALAALFAWQIFSAKTKKLYAMGWKVAATALGLSIALGAPAMWALIEYAFLEPALWR